MGKEKGFIKKTEKVTGYRKAAEFLILIGKEEAARILKHLSEDEIKGITEEIAQVKQIDEKKAKKILEEFGYLIKTRDLVARGGLDKAREIVIRAFGEEKGNALLKKIEARTIPHPFTFLSDMDIEQVQSLLKNESAPVLAVILSHLEHGLAANLLSSFSSDVQKEIALRIARMKKIAPEVLKRTEEVLLKKVKEQGQVITKEINGQQALVEILKSMDFHQEQKIISDIEEKDPDLAGKIKEMLFTIDIVLDIRDKDLQNILNEFSDEEIALMLKGKTHDISEYILSNMSGRRRKDIEYEYKLLGEVKKSDADKITRDFLHYLRKKMNNNEIVVLQKDDILVE